MFLKRTTAFAAAAATVLTLGASAPAHADDNDDLARLLFGILAAGTLAAALNDDHKSRSRTSVDVRVDRNERRSDHQHRQRAKQREVHVSPRHNRHAVPAACQRRLMTQHGTRTFVGQRCLQQNGYNISRLPNSCARELDFGRREVKAWGVSCLAGKGFRLR